ncbi:MAG: hypothetical protein KA515_01320 [Candidatus Pacebacteria bacterium]|nr:hypothetical protein [Candidatus Paceibacterota bacterium]
MLLSFQKKNTKIIATLIFILLFTVLPWSAFAANLILSPATGNYEVGDRVAIKVSVSSDKPFNAVSGVLSFPAVFSVDSVSKIGSVLDFWVTEPIISRTNNTIKFEGLALGGFNGASGTVLVVNLKAVKAGSGTFSFQSGQILANDGEGTDITGYLNNAIFTVTEPAPKPEVPKTETPVPEVKLEPKVPEEAPQPKPSLKAPEIIFSSKYGNQSILGNSDYANTQVLVTFLSTEGSKVFIVGNSDKDGEFNVLVPRSLKHGMYSVSAVMIKSDKTNSESSNTIMITVGSILSDIGKEVWVFIGLLLLSIIYLLVRMYFHFKKDKNLTKDLRHEVKEVETLVHKSLDMLREDVEEYDSKKTTLAEHKKLLSIKKDIDTAEKVISKEFDDIK